MNQINTSTAIKDKLLSKKNVLGILPGTKIVNGVDTGEECIVIEVSEKVDVATLAVSDIIPDILSDNTTKTDVVVGEPAFVHGRCPANSAKCTDHGDSFYTVKGGIEIGRSGWVGTLAGIARDKSDGSLVGLTNAHVTGIVYNPGGYDWGTNPSFVPDYGCFVPETEGVNYTQMMYQPYNLQQPLGYVKKTVPVYFNITSASGIPDNYVDAAIMNIDHAIDANIYPSPIPHDSTILDAHINTAPLFDFNNVGDISGEQICVKIGRTTGRTVLPPDDEYVDGVYGYVVTADYAPNVGHCSGYQGEVEWLVSYIHTIKIQLAGYDPGTTPSWRFSNSGDSGSMCYIWNPLKSRWEILGLVFAGGGSEGTAYSVICRIDYVVKQLQIGENWTDQADYGGLTFEQYVHPDNGGSYTTVLPDVAACTGLWDGSITVPSSRTALLSGGGPSHPDLQVSYRQGGAFDDQTLCYTLCSASGYTKTHELDNTNSQFRNTTTTSCSTLNIAWDGAYYTVNGFYRPELFLERDTAYTLNIDSSVGGAANQNIDKPLGLGKTCLTTTTDVGTDTIFVNTKSLAFDGLNDYVAIGSSGDLGTFSAWFKPATTLTSASAPQALVGFTGDGTYATSGGIFVGGNIAGAVSNEIITIYTGDYVYAYASTTESISTDWHHVAVRWTGSDYEIYLDGVQVKNTDGYYTVDSKYITPFTLFNIGRRNDGSKEYAGLVDEVAVWSTPLSESDIAAIYNNGIPDDLASLNPDGWWRMGDGDTYDQITDHGGSNDGTMTSMDSGDIVTDSPDPGGAKWVFNGESSYNSSTRWGLSKGTYIFQNIPSGHPMAILNSGSESLISYTGDVAKKSSKAVTGSDNDATYDFYHGDMTVTVAGDFTEISIWCYNHGSMGGEDLLQYNTSCPDPTIVLTPSTTMQLTGPPADDVVYHWVYGAGFGNEGNKIYF